jgi:uncharacterized protein YfdQ (DUF2303 family)
MPDYQNYQTESAVAASLAADSSLLKNELINPHTALINPSVRILDLEQFDAGRHRKRGTFGTQDIDSFADYIEINAQPEHISVFVDKNQMRAVAILNFDADDFEQGCLDHKAVLDAERTVMFKKLVAMHDMGRCNQKVFAEFLEDWGHKVIARDGDGNEIENAKAINAVRSMRIDESAQTDSHAGNYRESRSRLESVEAKSMDGALPAYFSVNDECYQGIPARNLALRLGISNDDGQPVFKLEIKALQSVRDELAKEFADIVAGRMFDGVSICIGQFQG